MDRIKEILRTMRAYAGVYQFWLILGGVLLVSAGAFVWLVFPLMDRNSAKRTELESLKTELQNYANAEQVPRQALIEAIKKQKQQYKQQEKKVEARLAEYDQNLERHFREEAQPDQELGPTDWKVVYNDRWDALEDKLYENVPNVQGRLVRRDFGDRLPSEAQMRGAEKKYWIQKALVDTLAELNAARVVVPVFNSFEFPRTPQRLLSPSHGVVQVPGAGAAQGGGMGGGGSMYGGGGGSGAGGGGGMYGGGAGGGTGGGMYGGGAGGGTGTGQQSGQQSVKAVAPGGEEAVYRAIPFRLKVSLEFQHITVFLRKLLTQDVPFEITGVNLRRTRQRMYGSGRPGRQESGGYPGGYSGGGYPGPGGAMGGPGAGSAVGGMSPYMMGGRGPRSGRQQGEQGREDRRRGRGREEEQQQEEAEGQKKLVSVIIHGYVADYLGEGEVELVAERRRARSRSGGQGGMPGMGGAPAPGGAGPGGMGGPGGPGGSGGGTGGSRSR